MILKQINFSSTQEAINILKEKKVAYNIVHYQDNHDEPVYFLSLSYNIYEHYTQFYGVVKSGIYVDEIILFNDTIYEIDFFNPL